METPLFFKNSNYNLFGVLHEPDTSPSTPWLSSAKLPPQPCPLSTIGIVFCHPFAEEKLISHRVMNNLARSLTKTGIYCLRFDYMGHGDSDGNFEDSTIETRLSDIRRATEFLKERTKLEQVGLLGIRFGATLAVLASKNYSLTHFLILISPIIDGNSYINQCLRSNLTTQMAIHKKIIKNRDELINDLMADKKVNIDGYLLTKTLYQQIKAIDLLDHSLNVSQNALLVQVSRKENQPDDEKMKMLYTKCKSINSNSELLNVKEDYFWTDTKMYNPRTENIQETVVSWLSKIHAA